MKRVISLLLLLPLVAACSDIKQTVGLGRNNPDEFMVVKNPPLSMPPDFDLRPPDPSARKPTGAEPAATAAARAAGVNTATTGVEVEEATSPGVAALLTQAGATDVPKDIRATLDTETDGIVIKDRDFVDKLMIWKDTPVADPQIDAAAEAERVEETKTPEGFITGEGAKFEQEKTKAPLEGLFN
ncbi:MAG TPA: DUF3035 domain-containing protein [Alphaproteobacteria bacterium]|nr:DUF3035 domain-containing protein [Rhodospirillaceae bacterium]HRJ12646.1 DUF3035 domain-containing protein [Alphaproteobacteria bacterium]